jgi:hypothetical protein
VVEVLVLVVLLEVSILEMVVTLVDHRLAMVVLV